MTVNPMHKAHGAPRCTAKSKRTGQPCRAPTVARLAGMPDARCARRCARGQAERKLPARCEDEGNNRTLEAHQIAKII